MLQYYFSLLGFLLVSDRAPKLFSLSSEFRNLGTKTNIIYLRFITVNQNMKYSKAIPYLQEVYTYLIYNR